MAKRRQPYRPTVLERVSASRAAKKKLAAKSKEKKKKSKQTRDAKETASNSHKSSDEGRSVKQIVVGFIRDSTILSKVTPFHSLLLDVSDAKALKPVVATRAYTEVAAAMLQLVRDGGSYLILSWPKSLEWPGLAHSIANRKVSAERKNRGGINVLQYPASRENSERYRRTHIPAEELLQLARTAATEGANLPPRLHTYMTLNALESAEVEARRLNPSLFTLTPLIEYQAVSESWRRLGGSSLIEIRSALHGSGQYARRTHIEAYANELDNLETTSEANLRIPRSVSPRDFRRIARRNRNHIDLVVIDARANLIRNLSAWAKWFAQMAVESCKPEPPFATLVLTDDPEIHKRLEFEARKQVRRSKVQLTQPLAVSRSIRVDTSPWKYQQKRLKQGSKNRQFSVRVCGASSLHAIGKINELAREVDGHGASSVAVELRKLGGFLRGLSDTPVGQREISKWLRIVTADWSANAASNVAARFVWAEYRLRLLARLEDLGGASLPATAKAIELGDKIAEAAQVTEVESEVLQHVQHAISSRSKIAVVVPAARHIAPLRAEIEALEHLDPHLVVVTSQKSDLTELDVNQLVIAGMATNVLARLLLADKLAGRVHIICSGYGGVRLRKQLESILEIEEFSFAHPAAKNIHSQIEPLVKSFERLTPPSQPSTDLSITPTGSEHEHLVGPAFATFYLEDYGTLDVGENTTILRRQEGETPSYLAVPASEIIEGDAVFVMEDDFREVAESLLEDVTQQFVTNSEGVLSQYLTIAKRFLDKIEETSVAAKARSITEKMQKLDADVAGEISHNMVSRWIRGIYEQAEQSDSIRTQSAKNKEHFLLFAEAMSIDRPTASVFWDYGIRQHRRGRILEGKDLAYLAKSILCGALDSTSLALSDEDQNKLLTLAYSSTHMISLLEQHAPDGQVQGDEDNA